jgi:16S rRNA (guanine527-N7)-methyltransferase
MVAEGSSVLDIGSGAGFPGIPLKVVKPSLSVTLIDASRKKINFLRHVIRTLQLKEIKAYHCRVEEITTIRAGFLSRPPSTVDGFDVIVCRALSTLDSLARMALPLLAEKGMLIAMKGNVAESELSSLRSVLQKMTEMMPGYEARFSIGIKRYVLPYIDAERSIVCIRIDSEIAGSVPAMGA